MLTVTTASMKEGETTDTTMGRGVKAVNEIHEDELVTGKYYSRPGADLRGCHLLGDLALIPEEGGPPRRKSVDCRGKPKGRIRK